MNVIAAVGQLLRHHRASREAKRAALEAAERRHAQSIEFLAFANRIAGGDFSAVAEWGEAQKRWNAER